MLKIDTCKNCTHYLAMDGKGASGKLGESGVCCKPGIDEPGGWKRTAPTDVCTDFKDRAGVAILDKAKDILKEAAPGKCCDCEMWHAPPGTVTDYCPEAQTHVGADAVCVRYKERVERKKVAVDPDNRACFRCEHSRGDMAHEQIWCTTDSKSVYSRHFCEKFAKRVPRPVEPVGVATPVGPSAEVVVGDRMDVMVGPPYTLIWVGNQIAIAQDDNGKEHAFDIKSMRFRKC